ncbi:TIR domain-containing protein [Herbidospora galbida]|uniref:TIR domain-containing protein n=1 Tax=Herbidospora galbida TaxID=2575442 RepID=A0A4V5UYX6_9ACTN|nr:TIR domain-containing protein [Herbidospora galbida]TKK86463.1 TIR domain-containing protein [Herbidospora galbida]
MPYIFLNYRTQSDAYAAALLDELLIRRFGADAIFRASRSIRPGVDYRQAILSAIKESRVILAVVGQGWDAVIREEDRRGEAGNSWARMELAEAIRDGTVIIPILLAGAPSLVKMDLPDDLRGLAHYQYLRFDYRNISQDFFRISEELVHLLSTWNIAVGNESGP